MAKVVWPEDTLEQLYRITAYLREFNPVAAVRTNAKLWTLGQSLARFPNRGRPTERGARELVTVRPYILAYRVEHDTVTILSIRHSARRPLD